MDPEQIKRIIVDQREAFEEKSSKENIIDREFNDYCKKYVEKPNILLLSGVRRCGKSVFSYLLFRGRKFAYINFDDERLYGFEAKDLNNVLEAFYSLYGDVENIILDEIQNVNGWELFASRLRESKNVIVTGSNATLLSGDMATRLTGRYIDFTIYPFSFKEYLKYKNIEPDIYSTKSISGIKNHLEDYIMSGGFPETYKFGEKSLITLYESIITKDVVLRYNPRYIKALKELSRILISNYSSEFTFNSLKNILSVKSVHTIKNYIEHLESAYLVIKLERFSYKLKEQIMAPKKIYAIDTGLINAVAFQPGPNKGRLIENLVLIELLRKKSVSPMKEVFYWKDHQHNEVDFAVMAKSAVRQLIQVCYNADDLGTKEREIKALIKASHELRCDKLLVITWEHEGEESVQGKKIEYVPLWKWLIS